MHARHRSPGNGYRSTSMGMGWGASRTSPDTSTRGHGFYSSENRSFNNRSFGRGQGQSKYFQQPPQPPVHRGDILMEAGRLAAEYLVSKGLLPPSAISGKWQNGSFKKHVGDYQDFRQQEDPTQGVRTSAHARLGTTASEVGSAKRRYSDDLNSRNHIKGRRRGDYYRSYSSEWGREYGKSGSWSDRSRVSPDMDGEDIVSGHYEEQQVGKASADAVKKSGQNRAPEAEEPAKRGLGLEKYNYPVELDSHATSSSKSKDEMDAESSKASEDLENMNLENGEMNGNDYTYENERQNLPDLPIQHSSVDINPSVKNDLDLLAFCKFINVPTKTRSALTFRASKVDQIPNKEDGDASDFQNSNGSDVLVQDSSLDDSKDDVLKNSVDDSKSPHSNVVPVHSAGVVGELHTTYGVIQGKGFRNESFSDRAFMQEYEQVSSFGMPNSVGERGEKRAAEDNDCKEPIKKPREWLPPIVTETEGHLLLSDSSENRVSSTKAGTSQDHPVITAVTQEGLVNSCQFSRADSESCVQFAQEKQLFPGSFKICDLNLMESTDGNDTHCSDSIPLYPSLSTINHAATPVDVGLLISNSNIAGEYSRRVGDGAEIEVIDLENDSTIENKDFESTQRKMDTAFASTDGFTGHPQNAGGINDVPDNYDGLMISEFLTSFSNCSSVPEDITPLQNEMSLHNAEGNFGDDDSIYMSLGEIPLSFIPAWEQPTPKEYEKPF
ncbi:hypothetical protein K2173_015441 [Erythroxylum novogranatense]|uniref:Uncharacterized protein n=1 Tax=Erythroxylum novogranatense TaxID=1862640 RepID=A0AAV8SSJ7_9ROSI|nr:hypothetical protein K2173_015441 [Erythroxylum novogranatense]